MRVNPALSAAVGLVVGFVVCLLLHAYPKDVVTRHRYCRSCAEYEETYREGTVLGGRSESKSGSGGPVGRLLASAVGDHEHQYTEWTTLHPTFGVAAEHPEVAERVRVIREIEASPEAISALEQAMRNDAPRTTKLIQRLIDPAEGLALSPAISALGKADASWEQRWQEVDAALQRSKR